jgi:hypothetical protein
MSIDLEAARQLLDFGNRLGPSQSARAEDQLEGAVALHNILERHGVAYLADEVGMGKTYVALGALALFRHFEPQFRVLIIAPRRNIQSKWVKEFRNFVRHNVRVADLRVRGLNFEPARPLIECERLSHFVREVTTDADRDFFLRMTSFSLPLQADGESTTAERLREQFLRELPWIPPEALDLRGGGGFKRNVARAINCALPVFDLVIVDEAHHLKHGAERTAARNEVLALMMGRDVEETPRWAKGFGPRAKRVLFLSATPLEESFKHVWNQLDVFGKGEGFADLCAPRAEVDEEAKKALARKFMVRRVTAIPVHGERLTKNRYRREWRQGGVRTFDEAIQVTDPRERLVVALVQKKVSELLGTEKFGYRFQAGMLASFESFQETVVKTDDAVFDGDQTQDESEKDGIDVRPLNTLARSYRDTFDGKELPHPKLDAIVNALSQRWATGRKALVFVRRVASVKELKRKLDDRYDDWLESKLKAELPAHAERLTGLFARYRKEKTELRNSNQDVVSVEASPGSDEAGGADTFFAWFFRGDGPGKVFSGAALKKRFASSSGVFATFFDENVVAVVLQVPPSEVGRRLCEVVGTPHAQLMASLENRARQFLPRAEKVTRAARFEAVQAAAIEQLSLRADALGTLAKHVWHELYGGLGRQEGARTEDIAVAEYLAEETFFTQLRRRPDLARALFPGLLPTTPEEFTVHWFRVALLGSLARLGHSLIDLYITVVKGRPSLELGRSKEEDSDDPGSSLVGRFLDLLEGQASVAINTRPFGAFDELRLAAENFDAIFDSNLTHLRGRKLIEVRRAVGSTLGEQQPIGGMHGSVNRSLISQFRMPGYPLVLVTTDLLQEGEDLHTFCSDVFHYGISWTPSAMEQRIGRIDRVRSQTERRLVALSSLPTGDDKLQVFVPTLRETVEVLQVNRVLRRMNRFVELMHEGIGQMRNDDPKVDVELESLESIEPPPALPDVELKSSFCIDPTHLKGRRTATVVSEKEAGELLHRFRQMRECTQLGEHRVEWESIPTDREDRLFGTALLGARQQPFGLYLRLIRGRPVLKCVSPIGRVGAMGRVSEILGHAKQPWTRIGVTATAFDGSYDLTIEDEVLLGSASSDLERLRLVVLRVVSQADQFELALLDADEPLKTFQSDLAVEGTHEV